jgi:hypothetical protein
MTTAGSDITKASITAQMDSIRDTYNAGIVWSTTTHPFQNAQTGRTYYWNNYGNVTGTFPVEGTATGLTTDFAAAITDTNVTASTIITQFRAYAVTLSKVRKARLRKFFNTNGTIATTPFYDTTNVTNLKQATYSVSMNAVTAPTISGNNTISAADLDAFVAALSTAISTNRNATLDFQERYCHSSCHSSCHGSI